MPVVYSWIATDSNLNSFSRDDMFFLNKYVHMLCLLIGILFCRDEVSSISNSFIYQ